MAKTADAVKSFLEDLAAKLQPLKVKEMEGFLEYKKEEVINRRTCLKRPLSKKTKTLAFKTDYC